METGLFQQSEEQPRSYTRDQQWLIAFTRSKNRRFAYIVIALLSLMFLIVTALLVYSLWFKAIPALSVAAFLDSSFSGFWVGTWSVLLYVLGVSGIILAAFIPVIFFIAVLSQYLDIVSKGLLDKAETDFLDTLRANELKAAKDEETLKKDSDQLIIWVNYSRIELEQYYRIGLQQGRKSYRSSMIAMWIGFVIMMFGISINFFPSIGKSLGQKEASNVQVLTIASGIVSEIIAGLFLWIYQSSKNQLTYFYNRQIFIHNSLLAYKIANTIKTETTADSAKKTIIDKILEFASSAIPEKDTEIPKIKAAAKKLEV